MLAGIRLNDPCAAAMGQHMSPESISPSRGGVDQWVGYAETAEPIEMPFSGLTHAGSGNNILAG